MNEQLSLFPLEPVPVPVPAVKEPEPKKRNANPQVWTVINGQEITYSFRQAVVKWCGKQCDPARVFYRAMASGAKNPMGWIREGFKRPEEYCYRACKAEYDDPKAVHAWIKDEWERKNGTSTMSIGEILRGMK